MARRVGWGECHAFLSILSTFAEKVLNPNRLMPVAVSALIFFRWLISRRWQFRGRSFQRLRCTFLPWLMQRKHELYEKMHTITVFASFFSYRNFIYTWNDSFISFLPFFSCFSSNNSSNPHHILIKTFFRRVFLLHDSFDSFSWFQFKRKENIA